jgi:hypothetical protein
MFGTPSMTTATLGGNDPEIGTRCQYQGAEYVFVYNNGGTQISVHQGATVTATSGYSVTVSSVTGTDQLAGVCVHNTIAASAYGWLLTKGWAIVAMGANNSAAAGEPLALGTDGNFGRVGSANTDTALGINCGKAASAIASGGSGGCWVRAFL